MMVMTLLIVVWHRQYSGGGDDIVISYADGDTLNGGMGADTLDYSAQSIRFHIDVDVTNINSVWYGKQGQSLLLVMSM